MLERTMKQVLSKKVNSWLKTITDEEVVKAIKKDLIITGGCFTSMIQNEVPKDFDCYFATKETAMLVAQYYIELWDDNKYGVFIVDGESDPRAAQYNVAPDRVKIIVQSQGVIGNPNAVGSSEELGSDVNDIIAEIDETAVDEIISEEKREFFPVFMSSNAITLSNGIQIVVRFYGEPAQIHDTYDFVHTKAYWRMKDNELVIPTEVYECVVNKTLIYTGSKYPVCSIFRVRKFINRGWRINAGQLLKMCMQVSELDLQNVAVLEDQLIGVDSAYFMHLISMFRERQAKDDGFVLSTRYILSVIDKVFG